MPKYYNKQTKKFEEKGTLRGTKSDSDIVGKTARLKEVTRGEKNKAIADFKKMKEKNLANFTRPSSKAGMSSKSSGSLRALQQHLKRNLTLVYLKVVFLSKKHSVTLEKKAIRLLPGTVRSTQLN
jgi:hypothetical protein